ncbi:hypothetical protein FSARC_9260 [Fusarium sarcochroum]|uniref:Uncharacterized protein n=1 Tax=Fusarium sarcochroum TaxID=1208366 RepID=A0A8H4TRU7_9HYPO|nr:hypothetical protein FSARC_9260 [Fusarium sarcochroum]
MALLSYLYSWVKPRQNKERSSSISLGKKKRSKSCSEKMDKEDHQRSKIIRKSLQSRASSRATMRTDDFNYDTEEEEEERNTNLRTDWKAYEADIQRNKSTLMRSHPGVDRARVQTRAGSSSNRPQPQSFGSSSTNSYSPISPTSSNTPTSPASPAIGRAF